VTPPVVVGRDRPAVYNGLLQHPGEAVVAHTPRRRVAAFAARREARATENIKVPHSAKFDHETVKRELGLGAAAWDAFIQQARALAKVKLDDSKALHVLREGWADAVDSEAAEMDYGKFGALPTIERIMKLYKGGAVGSDMDSAAGTAWGLVNAVTEFYDHHARAKLTDNRLESAWFGKGNFVKTCLFEQALELV
jgi:hypothetical protein